MSEIVTVSPSDILVEDTSPVWSPFIITDAGLQLRQKVIAEGGTVYWCDAIVGEGKPDSEVTDILAGVYPALIKRNYAQHTNHLMVIEINNQKPNVYDREVLVTEVGVYAKLREKDDPILYGYAYCVKGYATMPPGGSSARSWNLVFDTKISNSPNITIVYDGSAIHVTHDEMELILDNYYTKPQVDALLTAQLLAQSTTEHVASIAHSLGFTPKGVLYATEYAAGVGGAGDGPAGGEKSVEVPCRLELTDYNILEIYTIKEYAGRPEVNRINEQEFVLVYPDRTSGLYLSLR